MLKSSLIWAFRASFVVFFLLCFQSSYSQQTPTGDWIEATTADPCTIDGCNNWVNIVRDPGSNASARTRKVPYYVNKTFFKGGTPFQFKNLGSVSGGGNPYFRIWVFYKFDQFSPDKEDNILFDPADFDPGVYAVSIVADCNLRGGSGSSYWEYDVPVKPFNITLEDPRWLDLSSIRYLCTTAGAINLRDYFQGATGVQFTIDGTPASVLNPASLSQGDHIITASKVYDNGAYSESKTITIISQPTAVISASGATTFCQGGSVTLSAPEAPAGQTWSYAWSTGETSRQIVVSSSQVVNVTVTNQSCSTTAPSVTVSVLPAPQAEITYSGSLTLCDGQQVTLVASAGSSYTWINGNGQVVGSARAINVSTSGTYNVIVTGSNGCSDYASPVTVSVSPNPQPTVVASGPTTFCEGGSIILTAQSSGSPSAYLWSTGETGSSIAVTTSGIYSVTVTNGNSCQRTSTSVVVNVLPVAKPTISANGPLNFCQGSSITLTSSPASSYKWSNGATSQSITVSESGNYFVTTANSSGCERTSDVVNIATLPNLRPEITATGATTICEGQTTKLSVSNAQSGVTYTWSNGDTGYQIEVSQAGSYYVIATNANGCSTSSTAISISVLPIQKPHVTASGPLTFCQPNTVTLSVSNPEGASKVRWSTGQIGNSIVVNSSGSYIAYLSKNGCERASDPVTVTVKPIAKPAITATNTSICEGSEATLTVSNPQANTTYSWSNGQTGLTTKVSTAGSYFVIATNSNGCAYNSDPVSIVVKQIQKPNVTASGPLTFCQPNSVRLTVSNPEGASIRWSTGETGISTLVNSSGSYIAYLSKNGCERASDPVTVTVKPMTKPEITATNTSICEGSEATLTVFNPQANTTYSWSNGQTGLTTKVSTAGSYFVIATNSNGCAYNSDPVSIVVKQIQKPNVTASGPLTFCQPNSVRLTVSNPEGASIRWSTGETGNSIVVNRSGSYVAYLSKNGCERASDTVRVTVKENVKPIIVATSTDICEGTDATLSVSNIQPNTTYSWSDGQTGPEAKITVSGTYYLIATNSNGCSELSDPIPINVRPIPIPLISASGPLVICEGSDVKLSVTNLAATDQVRWSHGATGRDVFVSEAGSYVAYIQRNGCERASDPVVVTVKENKIPLIEIEGARFVCEGDSVRIKVADPRSGITYRWNTGEIGTFIYAKTAGQYFVTAENSNGCAAISTPEDIILYPLAKPTISASTDLTICNFDTMILTINETAHAYRWSTGETTRSISVTTPGSYVAYTLNDKGCERPSEPTVVTVKDNKFVSISVIGNTTFCEGDSVILTSSLGASYIWSTGETTRSIVVKRSGYYNVEVTNYVDCKASSESLQVIVYPIPKPTVTVEGSLDFCEGDSVKLTINETAHAYRWSNGRTTKSIFVNTPGRYSAYVQNVQGCEREAEPLDIVVFPNSKPIITSTRPEIFCEGDSTILQVNRTAGYTYEWNTGETSTSIKVKTSGDYFVISRTPNGCENVSAAKQITVYPIPVPTIETDRAPDICQGDSVVLTIKESAASYRWNTGETSKSITVKTAGKFRAYIKNSQGCERESALLEVMVRPNQVPVITSTRPETFCEGDSTILQVNRTAGYTYEWNTGETSTSIKVKASGDYFVISRTPNGCENVSAVKSITVYPIPVPTIETDRAPDICQGDSVVLTIKESAASYRWSTGETSKSITVKTGGTYIGYVSNAEGCQRASYALTVVVRPNPKPSITALGPTTICQGEHVILRAPAGMASYLWSNGATTQDITVSNSNSLTVITTLPNGCSNTSDPIKITVKPSPKPTISSRRLGRNN